MGGGSWEENGASKMNYNEAAQQRAKQTTPNPARPKPKIVIITEAQTKEAFGLYLDFLFDAPHGTYKIKEWGTAFGSVDLSLEQE